MFHGGCGERTPAECERHNQSGTGRLVGALQTCVWMACDCCERRWVLHELSPASFIPLCCGEVITSACKSCALQCVQLKCNLRVSCLTAMCSLDWAALRLEGHECQLALCSLWTVCEVCKQPFDAFHHSEAHLAHGQLVPLMLARDEVTSSKVGLTFLVITQGTIVAGPLASVLCGVRTMPHLHTFDTGSQSSCSGLQ